MVIYEKYVVTCKGCGYNEDRTHVQVTHTGWWQFNNYKTNLGNTYSGHYCPACSNRIYEENKD